jgi:Holliday junction resolvase RusA-like endonuclease
MMTDPVIDLAHPAASTDALYTHVHALGWHHAALQCFRFRLVVLGEPAVLKNSKQIINLPGRRPMLVSSSQAEKYLKSAAQQLRAQWFALFCQPIPLDVQLNASIVSYLGSHRRTDASNLYEAPQDALKACGPKCKPGCPRHAGVITDDYQIASHDGSRRLYDKDNPRVEIVLTPYRGDA